MTFFWICLAIAVIAAALTAASKTAGGQRFEQKYSEKGDALQRDIDARRQR